MFDPPYFPEPGDAEWSYDPNAIGDDLSPEVDDAYSRSDIHDQIEMRPQDRGVPFDCEVQQTAPFSISASLHAELDVAFESHPGSTLPEGGPNLLHAHEHLAQSVDAIFYDPVFGSPPPCDVLGHDPTKHQVRHDTDRPGEIPCDSLEILASLHVSITVPVVTQPAPTQGRRPGMNPRSK